MKKLLLIFIVLLLSSCDTTVQQTVYDGLPIDLEDCTFYTIRNGLDRIEVVRCPNSAVTTTYMQGKTQSTVVTIDN